ncbi:Glycosyltransferase Family 2 protein [Gigaspora rosea]|uniref:Chitin synthase n=1 Tax=Gigaspora rosea TaxID=44941 RepID=A0A397VEK6_9GLOM|nr:Glycosyltransferase Family 2 protein [Gigaspora rosea]
MTVCFEISRSAISGPKYHININPKEPSEQAFYQQDHDELQELSEHAIYRKEHVELLNGNFVIDCPVPKNILKNLPHNYEEFTHLRYTACTSRPETFKEKNFILRQTNYNRETELFIMINMYDDNEILLSYTLNGIMENIAYLCSLNDSTWGNDAWKKVVVCIIPNSRNNINEHVLAYLTVLGVYQNNIAKAKVNNKVVEAHIYEYTTFISIKHSKNAVETKKDEEINAFSVNPEVAGVCGNIDIKDRSKFKLLNPIASAQSFNYKISYILDKPFESIFGYISSLSEGFSAYRQNHPWKLYYVKSAHTETNAPENLPEFIHKQKRYLKKYFLASFYAITHFYYIWRSDTLLSTRFVCKQKLMNFWFHGLHLYGIFSSTSFLFFTILLAYPGVVSVDKFRFVDRYSMVSVSPIYVVLIFIQIIFALFMSNKPQGSKFYDIFLFFDDTIQITCFMIYMLNLLFFILYLIFYGEIRPYSYQFYHNDTEYYYNTTYYYYYINQDYFSPNLSYIKYYFPNGTFYLTEFLNFTTSPMSSYYYHNNTYNYQDFYLEYDPYNNDVIGFNMIRYSLLSLIFISKAYSLPDIVYSFDKNTVEIILLSETSINNKYIQARNQLSQNASKEKHIIIILQKHFQAHF